MSLQVIIIEDEAPAFRRLNNLLLELMPDIRIIEVLDSVEDAVKWLKSHESPDLIFSDIQLADGLSFEIYEQVNPKCPVIFTTAYDEYMLDAFRTNGIDYLLKPVIKEELENSLNKFQQLKEQLGATESSKLEQLLNRIKQPESVYKSRFLVKTGDRLTPVSCEKVAFFNSTDGVTYLVDQNARKYIVDFTLDELEKVLNPDLFFRLNRQFLVQINAIEQIHQYFKGKLKVNLQPKEEAIVSREKASLFKQWMDR